ncbi:MAG: magnesium transporter MgtC [Gemmatimonadales bacterium]|nr:magnesium transporter MgtC [Gemmatimonadales bacterium]NIN11195.1 magnesium transporter MgtC [Gemmatimonadales bacterium]NIN49794.1 magnesium transporter MgtC [Gemmatimonadales bacterium]NIP07258.1 magnesium transporter MgtC [Gemmatimonadales bacterium]NIR02953.1 magnesium transporter MgtC [Gemmatimonadales bacterium]
MSEIWADVVRELRLDLLGQLVMAVLLGGAVGLERELRGKAAGLRTNILICAGATLFTQLSIAVSGPSGDPGRIAAQIVTGVGFIGAGTILHSRGHISGLTSAATIWLVAAIGVAVGAGAVFEATGATLLVVLVLAVLRRVENFVNSYRGVSRVVVEVEPEPERVNQIERIVRQAGLEVEELRSEQRGNRLAVEVVMSGPARLHDRAKLGLLRASGAYMISAEE